MAQPIPGPWRVGYRATAVLATGADGGDVKICDIRGWGYLTGNGAGALGLSGDKAVAIQTANCALIAAAPDLLNIAKRWAALDGGAWNIERHAAEKRQLVIDTCVVIAKAEAQS